MAIPRATSGNNSQFTYDFGITIAQSTVNKLVKLTGATLTLASAYYALRTNAEKYVDTLRENSLRFGGILSTMKAMEAAQNRLIKGQSFFSVDDHIERRADALFNCPMHFQDISHGHFHPKPQQHQHHRQ